MLGPLTALGVASNITQFVDLGLKATCKFREIHGSVAGATEENMDLEVMTRSFIAINAQLYSSIGSPEEADALGDLCQRCAKTADEMIVALESFKVLGKKTRWKSARKALKGLWGREKVEGIRGRLLEFRADLNLHHVVNVKYETHFYS